MGQPWRRRSSGPSPLTNAYGHGIVTVVAYLMRRGVRRVLVGGEFKPVLGAVSVNHFIVEIIGRHGENTVSRLAGLAGIMTYSLVVGLNPLTPRVYYEGGRPVALSEPRLVER